MNSNLFAAAADDRRTSLAPLADRMRPRTLDEIVGQQHLTGPDGSLRGQLERGHVPNMVLVGPPGSGKTTVARLIAERAGMQLEELSAVACGLADVRRIVAQARETLGAHGRQTVLFLDEIHRFNRAQQDALLPAVEAGDIRLVGATTENPYVSINRALLSRLVVYEIRPLSDADVGQLLERALTDTERGLARAAHFEATDEALELVVRRSSGDARSALTLLETAAFLAPVAADTGGAATITEEQVRAASGKLAIRHDRAGDQHYDLISAYIKSMRAGDADEALRYLAAMVEGGEDPVFIARRLAIFASEDVGPADPQALLLAAAALTISERIGFPEARITLSQVTRHCAEAPKSRAAYDDIAAASEAVRQHGTPEVPEHLRGRQRSPRVM